MLVGGEKFCVSGAGIGGGGRDCDRCVDIESHRWEADFLPASLVTELEGNLLGAEGSVGLRGERDADNNFILVDVQRSFGEREGVEFTLRVGDFAGRFETGRKIGAEIRGDKVLGARVARGDVETYADF